MDGLYQLTHALSDTTNVYHQRDTSSGPTSKFGEINMPSIGRVVGFPYLLVVVANALTYILNLLQGCCRSEYIIYHLVHGLSASLPVKFGIPTSSHQAITITLHF